MNIDLQNLKLAIETGDPGFYHGNWNDVFGEVVDELIRLSDEVDEEVTKLQDEKDDFDDSVVEILSCKCEYDEKTEQHKLKSKCNLATLLIDSGDISEHEEYEIIVRVLR